MKSKCSFILKASTALVLALLMLFGTVATSVAAVVENTAASSDKAADEAVDDTAVETTEEPAADIAEEEMSGEAIETVFDKLKKQCGELETAESEAEAPAPKRNSAELAETGDDTTYYMHIGVGNEFKSNSAVAFTYDSSKELYYASYELVQNSEYPMVINTTSVSLGDSDKPYTSQSVTSKASTWNPQSIQFDYFYERTGYSGYSCFKFKTQTTQTVYFTFTTPSDGLVVRSSLDDVTPGGGGGGSSGAGVDTGTSWPESWQRLHDTDKTNATIYYDNSITQWTSVKFRIGRHWNYGDNKQGCTSYAMTKVTGTDNIYKVTGIAWNYYNAVYFTNGSSGTDGDFKENTDIETVASQGFTAYTSPKGFDFGTNASTYYFIGQSATVGTTSAPQRVLCYGAANGSGVSTASDYTTYKKSVTNNSVDHGTVVVNWTNPSGTAQTIAEGATTADMLIGTKLTVAMTPDTLYGAGTATVTNAGNASSVTIPAGGSTFTSGNTKTDVTGSFNRVETTHAITTSVSPSGSGTISPANGTEVGESTATTITATPADSYQFSSWTFGDGITGASTTNATTTITTNASGDYTVQANFTKKPTHTITVKSSNNVYGTATASVANAYEGQSVTLTAAENTGTFSKWKLTSGTVSGVDNETANTITFTMGSTDLVITANFVAYSGTSNFYYNNYGDNGQPADTHYGARMTEAKLNGETYSYYHVTGRTEADQLFTVSYESPKYDSYYCFFEIDDSWGNTLPKAQFYSTDGKNLGDWTDMSWFEDKNSKKRHRIAIPDGARSVKFKHGGYETSELFFTSGYNGWYTNGSMSDLTGYISYNPVETDFYENFNGTNKYTNACNSGGFNAHGANRGESHSYTKPNGMDETQRGDYYILVLYENKTYTINGIQHRADKNPEIIWLPTLPDETTDLARIYAKDGCINADRKSTRVIGTTNITASNTVKDVSRAQISNITDYATARAEKGKSITITTEINSTYASKYIVKGWDVNGDTYCIDPVASANTYTATFTVPDANKVEITPIYWLKSTYDTTTVFVKDFNKAPKEWGNALYYYYWGGSQVDVENEEKYPGQPFVHAGGQYYAQVPTDVTGITLNNAVWDTVHAELIMGLASADSAKQAAHYQTYDYDNFAKIIKEKTNINSIYFTFKYESKKDNFGSNSGGSSIIISQFDDTNGNGWEEYKDTLGRPLNIFGGTEVSGSGRLYVVSNGYARNYQGNYATEWSIYYDSTGSGTTANLVGTIPGSALILDAAADFSKSEYDGNYNPKLSTYLSVWNTLNTSTYKNLPVYITYEQGINGDLSRINTSYDAPKKTERDPATRIDGKWDYTKNDDYVTANIKIQLSADNGVTYTDDAFSSGNTGTTTQAEAYFNNTDPRYQNSHEVTLAYEVPVSTTNTFKLKTVPKPSTGYQFVGWYRLDDSSDHPELISTLTDAESLMSSKATFIARYKLVTSGNLVINHDADGAGGSTKHTVKVEIYDNEELVNTFEDESVTIDDTYITSSSNYKIKVTLTAKADVNSYIANDNAASNPVPTVACSQDDSKFYNSPAYTRNVRFANSQYPIDIVTAYSTFNVGDLYTTTSGTTTQSIKVLTYTTTFNKLPTYTINYKYHGRQSGDGYLTFTRTITLSPDEAEGKTAAGDAYSGNEGHALTATYKTTDGDGLVNDITANAPNANDLKTEVFNKVIAWSVPSTVTANTLDVIATESEPDYTLTYSYVDINGDTVNNKTVTKKYNTLITLDGNNSTFATAPTQNGAKFAYWADENGKPLTTTREYKMRLVNNVTIHPVYEAVSAGWNSAIEKITRTHETSDNSDFVYTDFALRFTGFDDSGSFITINPNFKDSYRVGVAIVYDTAGNNTTHTDEEIKTGVPLYDLTQSSKYGSKEDLIRLLVTNRITTAKLADISSTTYVSMFDADNTKLTNFNRMDYAVKYNYNTYYKRSYDAYAYVIDKNNNSVLAVSPVKSGYIFDGNYPVGN